jgi:hypothetical protein
MHTQTIAPPAVRRFVDAEDLVCPDCLERVRCAPPAYWRVAGGLPVPGFSHQDRTALCRGRDGRLCEPVEVPR